jgi:hypothetical protein
MVAERHRRHSHRKCQRFKYSPHERPLCVHFSRQRRLRNKKSLSSRRPCYVLQRITVTEFPKFGMAGTLSAKNSTGCHLPLPSASP